MTSFGARHAAALGIDFTTMADSGTPLKTVEHFTS